MIYKKYKVLIAVVCGIVATSTTIGLVANSQTEDIEVKSNANIEIYKKTEVDVESIEDNIVNDENTPATEEDEVVKVDELSKDNIGYTKAEVANTNTPSDNNSKNEVDNTENNSVVNENNNTANNSNNNSSSNTTVKPEEDKVEEKEPIKDETVVDDNSNEPKVYKDGTYEGSARGYERGLQVSVQVLGGKITSVVVVDHNDTPMFANEAIELIPLRIIQAQSTEVDTVSGATYTSKGIITAVNKALSNA